MLTRRSEQHFHASLQWRCSSLNTYRGKLMVSHLLLFVIGCIRLHNSHLQCHILGVSARLCRADATEFANARIYAISTVRTSPLNVYQIQVVVVSKMRREETDGL